ncbi:MAG: hypothetical protein F6K18_05960 [Okeania sp. SIO2C2]|uniref:hypothetical protein n=1 Tax=Okeania sp. SIO2C2 TaxID=2607787 RepID=UPI0013BDBA92|nr:hypothetical protein [Okeania sp. SIO2C2]NEP86404.1 hypothetical protein [Okeania sp. SIO2C2]
MLREEYLAIEPYIEKIFQGMPVDKNLTQEELNKFKIYLKEIPQKYLSYTQLTRDLDHYRLTIDINAQNYKRELNHIQSQLPGENLSFLSQFFDEDCRLFREQLQSDLGYFQHGAALLEKAMTAIQGRVDIEQAQSDRSFQNTIAIMGVGLTSTAVGATVAPYIISPEPGKPLLLPFSSNNFHPLTQALFLSLGFGVVGAAFTVIIQILKRRIGRMKKY